MECCECLQSHIAAPAVVNHLNLSYTLAFLAQDAANVRDKLQKHQAFREHCGFRGAGDANARSWHSALSVLLATWLFL